MSLCSFCNAKPLHCPAGGGKWPCSGLGTLFPDFYWRWRVWNALQDWGASSLSLWWAVSRRWTCWCRWEELFLVLAKALPQLPIFSASAVQSWRPCRTRAWMVQVVASLEKTQKCQGKRKGRKLSWEWLHAQQYWCAEQESLGLGWASGKGLVLFWIMNVITSLKVSPSLWAALITTWKSPAWALNSGA